MSWTPCKLGDVMTLQRGHDLPEAQRRDGAVPVVSSSGVTGFHDQAKATGPGVVTGRYGTLGEVYYIDQDYWPLNTALYVVDFKGNHPRFASYLLKQALSNLQSDKAAVPGVNRNVLHALDVRCPAPSTQQRIAGILSAYDDLIENNRRRMVLLEDAARQLYQEWFVRLRFPGREHTRIVDGVPEGWRRGALQDLVFFQRGFDITQAHQRPGSIPVISSSGVTSFHDEAKAQGPGLVIGRKGTLGSVHYASCEYWPHDTTLWSKDLRGNSARFVYHYLCSIDLKHLNVGNSNPTLNRNHIHDLPTLLPPMSLRTAFAELVAPFHRLQENLARQNEKLRTARDLLLHRLMHGELFP